MRRPARVQTGQVSDVAPGPDRFALVVVLVVYVAPLLATVLLLARVGLPGLALALLAVEAGVSAAVVQAKRPEGGRLTAAGAALLGVAVAAGAGAVVLLV